MGGQTFESDVRGGHSVMGANWKFGISLLRDVEEILDEKRF